MFGHDQKPLVVTLEELVRYKEVANRKRMCERATMLQSGSESFWMNSSDLYLESSGSTIMLMNVG